MWIVSEKKPDLFEYFQKKAQRKHISQIECEFCFAWRTRNDVKRDSFFCCCCHFAGNNARTLTTTTTIIYIFLRKKKKDTRKWLCTVCNYSKSERNFTLSTERKTLILISLAVFHLLDSESDIQRGRINRGRFYLISYIISLFF